jgi:hypothetical protein
MVGARRSPVLLAQWRSVGFGVLIGAIVGIAVRLATHDAKFAPLLQGRFAWLGVAVILLAVGVLATVGTQDNTIRTCGLELGRRVPRPLSCKIGSFYNLNLFPWIMHCRRPQCEYDRRISSTQKSRQFSASLSIRPLTVVIDEAWLQGLLRPVGLLLGQLMREKRQYQIRRELVPENGVTIQAES